MARSGDEARDPLRGTTVFVARPVGRAAGVLQRLRALGADAVHLPTASLRVTDAPAAARAVLARAGAAHATVFTSASAVRHAAAIAPQLDFAALRTLAVGPATARALARRHAEPTLPGLRFDSEGVLALPELTQVRNRRIVLVTAPGGRGDLARTLAARGARIEHAYVYRRVLPRWRDSHHRAVLDAAAPTLLIVSSVEAIAALRTLAGADGWRAIRRGAAIASSARVARALRDAGIPRVHVARSALPLDLVEAARRHAR
ncbi:MAG TPA: uroporphyrinogen-III synthase, partial [Candidatus Saccharimonadia bacterium]|nr:uroporphyrinogen-III synthase [Candidatus Saccharimonadia bacterium]